MMKLYYEVVSDGNVWGRTTHFTRDEAIEYAKSAVAKKRATRCKVYVNKPGAYKQIAEITA